MVDAATRAISPFVRLQRPTAPRSIVAVTLTNAQRRGPLAASAVPESQCKTRTEKAFRNRVHSNLSRTMVEVVATEFVCQSVGRVYPVEC